MNIETIEIFESQTGLKLEWNNGHTYCFADYFITEATIIEAVTHKVTFDEFKEWYYFVYLVMQKSLITLGKYVSLRREKDFCNLSEDDFNKKVILISELL